MLLEAEINKCCPSGYVFGAKSNRITWVPKFCLSAFRTQCAVQAVLIKRESKQIL
jgi:hypothetical protein